MVSDPPNVESPWISTTQGEKIPLLKNLLRLSQATVVPVFYNLIA